MGPCPMETRQVSIYIHMKIIVIIKNMPKCLDSIIYIWDQCIKYTESIVFEFYYEGIGVRDFALKNVELCNMKNLLENSPSRKNDVTHFNLGNGEM